MAGNRVEAVIGPVDADGARDGARNLIPRRHPVLVRRAVGVPDQAHSHVDRRSGFPAQQRRRVGVSLSPRPHVDAVALQRRTGGMPELELVGAHRPRVRRQRNLRVDGDGRHVGAAQQHVHPCGLLVGHQAEAEPAPNPCAVSAKSAYQLSLHSGSGWDRGRVRLRARVATARAPPRRAASPARPCPGRDRSAGAASS